MSVDMIGGVAPPGMISTPETENLNSQNLTQAGIRQVSRAITEEYVIRLQALAYEDAKAGVCGQGAEESAVGSLRLRWSGRRSFRGGLRAQ